MVASITKIINLKCTFKKKSLQFTFETGSFLGCVPLGGSGLGSFELKITRFMVHHKDGKLVHRISYHDIRMSW